MTKPKPDFPERRVLVEGRHIVNNNINSTASKVNQKKPEQHNGKSFRYTKIHTKSYPTFVKSFHIFLYYIIRGILIVNL